MTKVFIVEDEEMIGMLLEEMLTNRGFEVVARATALDEAQRMGASESMDVALLDINLHGEPVFPLALQLKQLGIPFAFTSGYGAAGLPAEWADYPVFSKPYNMRELTESISRLANQGR